MLRALRGKVHGVEEQQTEGNPPQQAWNKRRMPLMGCLVGRTQLRKTISELSTIL